MRAVGKAIEGIRWDRLTALGVWAVLGFLTALASLDGRTPLATGLLAAVGGGAARWAALLGAGGGALVLLPFGAALRCCGVLVVVMSVLSAFRDTKWAGRLWFRPLVASAATLSVELAYTIQMGFTLRGVTGLIGSTIFAGTFCHYFSLLHHEPRPRREAPAQDGLRQRLRLGAEALKSLGESLGTPLQRKEENPAVIFDRAAEVVCRGCALRDLCWNKEYVTTFNAFNDATPALLERGEAKPGDFAPYFSNRCIHFPQLISAINTETRALLLRRQYRRELDRERSRTRGQYAQLTEFVAQAMAAPEAADETGSLTYKVAMSLRPRSGQRVCGDSLTYFAAGGKLYLLLSDGMGSGREAQRESQMTLRLLEQFLKAGIQAEPALRTMNAALNLRSDESGTFTTIDLMVLGLKEREASLYKYGAAPSYIKRNGAVRRLTGASLPAGLQDVGLLPEPAKFPLEPGSFFVMVSDGVADALSDKWLQDLLAGFPGEDPNELAAQILRECARRRQGDDDCSVLCLYLPPEEGLREV